MFSRPEGFREKNSYGCFFDGEKNRLAHRIAYELEHGPISRGLVIRHLCNVRRCVRTDHLQVGTHEDNVQDMIERHRMKHAAAVSYPLSHQQSLPLEET